MLLWLAIGLVVGGLIGRLLLGRRPRDWAPPILFGVLGSAVVGFIVRGALQAATVPFSEQVSLAACVGGAILAAGSFALSARSKN
jgi:uncharacterized membrane protein YeaQ/YmgE (transglycosylase-associated protein family)